MYKAGSFGQRTNVNRFLKTLGIKKPLNSNNDKNTVKVYN